MNMNVSNGNGNSKSGDKGGDMNGGVNDETSGEIIMNNQSASSFLGQRPSFQLERQPSGRLLFVDAEGKQHADVVPVRAFPIAAPDEGVSLVSTDGHELAWIEDLRTLPLAMRDLLNEELALRDFMPEITRLVSVSTFGTPSIWTVETDRGNTTLILKGEEDIRRLGRTGLLIAGGEGVQYSVRDMGVLDRASRRLLERFL